VFALLREAVFALLREAATGLRDGGRMINLSTINTVLPRPGVAVYAASKAAVEFSVVAARELGPRRGHSPARPGNSPLGDGRPATGGGPNVLALVEVVATRRVKLPDPVIVC